MFRIQREILYIFFIPPLSWKRHTTPRSFFHLYIIICIYCTIYIYPHTDGVHTEGLIIIALEYTLKCRARRFFIYYALVCRPFYPYRSPPRIPTTTLGPTPPPPPTGSCTRLLLQSYTTHVVFGCARDRFLIPMHVERAVFTPPLCCKSTIYYEL